MSGLTGIDEPVFVAVANRTPGVVTLTPSNYQMLTIRPGEPGPDGVASFARSLTAGHPGTWVITATVLPMKFPGHGGG